MLILYMRDRGGGKSPTLIHGIKKKQQQQQQPLCQNDRSQLGEKSSGSDMLWDFIKFNFLALKKSTAAGIQFWTSRTT